MNNYKRKTGYDYGFKRGDCVVFKNGDIGIIRGRLCHYCSYIEVWTVKGEHLACAHRSLRTAQGLLVQEFFTSPIYFPITDMSDAAWDALLAWERHSDRKD